MAYEVGDRVIVDLQVILVLGVSDFEGKTEAAGTIIDRPGGVLYNVRLDDPLPPDVDHINLIGGGAGLKPLQ